VTSSKETPLNGFIEMLDGWGAMYNKNIRFRAINGISYTELFRVFLSAKAIVGKPSSLKIHISSRWVEKTLRDDVI
jgi:hypothetical protein